MFPEKKVNCQLHMYHYELHPKSIKKTKPVLLHMEEHIHTLLSN